MSIKQRNGVWYCDFTAPDGKRIRQSLDTTDKKQAQELHDKLKAEYWRITRLGDKPKKLFEEACLRWLREKDHKRSIDADKSKIAFFLKHFKGRDLASITFDEVQNSVGNLVNHRHYENWLAKRDSLIKLNKPIPEYKAEPVSQSTRYSYLAFMRSLLKVAANEWMWIGNAPMIKAIPPKNKRIRWLTKEQATLLINELDEPLKSVVTFALATGLRRSNIIDMEWSQIDMQRKVAWINPENAKAGKAIGVALNESACAVLKKQIGNHHHLVFVRKKIIKGKEATTRLRVDDNKAWKSALKRLGIEDFRFHDLRHTWASWLIQEGVPLSALQEMGGWETVEMVRRYAHLSPNHLSEHARKLDRVLLNNDTNSSQGINLVMKNIV